MKVDLHEYDINQDLIPFIDTMTSYSKSSKQIIEIRISPGIWSHWIATQDPLFINGVDPVTKVSDLLGGWLATLYGMTITSEAYFTATIAPHFNHLPNYSYLIFYKEIQQDLLALAQKVTP